MVVRAEISGVRGEDLRVRVDADVLWISGARTVSSSHDVRRLHQMEIAFGRFERAVHIQVPFEREQVTAHLEDGFLEVTLPKRRPQRIEVDSE